MLENGDVVIGWTNPSFPCIKISDEEGLLDGRFNMDKSLEVTKKCPHCNKVLD